MFRELLAIWRSKDPLRGMYDSLISMTDKGQRMFEAAWRETTAGQVRAEVRQEIRAIDVEVNRTERAIRRRLVEHLVVRSGADVPACLILMSVVKDAERVGDYCKDILDAAGMQARPLSESPCFGEFQGVYEDVRALFVKTRQALVDADQRLGEEAMLAERDIKARCDRLVEQLLEADLSCREGIPWALVARYLRRMAAHLSNLASSLVMPVHKIDYHDEKRLGRGRPAGPRQAGDSSPQP